MSVCEGAASVLGCEWKIATSSPRDSISVQIRIWSAASMRNRIGLANSFAAGKKAVKRPSPAASMPHDSFGSSERACSTISS